MGQEAVWKQSTDRHERRPRLGVVAAWTRLQISMTARLGAAQGRALSCCTKVPTHHQPVTYRAPN